MNRILQIAVLLLVATQFFCNSFSEKIDDLEKDATPKRLPIIPPIKVGDKTFYMETFFQANWFRAGQFCRLHGMHLASINDQTEDNKLGEALESFNLGNCSFWTSGNDLDQPQSFVWQSTGNSFTFTSWRPGEPDNLSHPTESQDCLLFDDLVIFAGWDDDYCSKEFILYANLKKIYNTCHYA